LTDIHISNHDVNHEKNGGNCQHKTIAETANYQIKALPDQKNWQINQGDNEQNPTTTKNE